MNVPVIRITAAAPVVYSLDGRSRARFAPGEIYQVPDHAARGMIRRGWARDAHEDAARVDEPELKSEPEAEQDTNATDHSAVEGSAPSEGDAPDKRDDTGEDESDDGEEDEGGDDNDTSGGSGHAETKRGFRRKRKGWKGT